MGGARQNEYEASLGLCWLGMGGLAAMQRVLRDRGAAALWGASGKRLLAWGMDGDAAKAYLERRRGFDLPAAEARLRQAGLRFIGRGSGLFPAELAHLQCPPLGLFVRGEEEVLRRLLEVPRLTVVGTRAATPEGMRATESFVAAAVARGIAVISGMALGIDGEAHRTTLARKGLTVAVLGCGADVVYPPRHKGLYEALVRGGLVLSELPPGARPSRWTFPHRNRLLAVLGDAVLVVEGSHTSGALQTAKCALDIGRTVFSVPGSIFKEVHRGCNELLRDGASVALQPEVLVEDFLLQTRIERGARHASKSPRAAREEQYELPVAVVPQGNVRRVLRALEAGPVDFDGLVTRTGMNARELGTAIGELETAGLVVRGGPGMYLRTP